MSEANGVDGSTIRYPAFLTEDAPRPPNNQRSIEPPERIELLVECISTLQSTGTRTPIDIGRLFTAANRVLQQRGRGERIFSFVEFKAVVRCLVMDGGRRFGVARGRLFERSEGERRGEREGEAVEEEEIVRQIREAMAEVDEGAGVSVRVG